MNKRYGMYVAKRFYPDKDFEDFTGIIGRKEIVTADGPYGGNIKDIFFYNIMWGDDLLRPTNKITEKGIRLVDFLTEENKLKLIEKEKKNLPIGQQLVYYETYIGEPFKGQDGFEFCGYDLLEDITGISAITDCGDLNAKFVHKLNKYGLLDNLDDAITEQKQLIIDFPDECHADCDIYGIWRYLKP